MLGMAVRESIYLKELLMLFAALAGYLFVWGRKAGLGTWAIALVVSAEVE